MLVPRPARQRRCAAPTAAAAGRASPPACGVGLTASTLDERGRFVIVSQAGHVLASSDDGAQLRPADARARRSRPPRCVGAGPVACSSLAGPRGVQPLHLSLTQGHHATHAPPTCRSLRDPRGLSTAQRLAARARWSSTTALAVMLVCAVLTLVLGMLAATRLTLNASFEKMIPRSHPVHPELPGQPGELRGLGNALRIVVENTQRRHLRPGYLKTLQADQRRALPHARRRPRLGEVAVGAGGALDRGHRGGLPRRPGDARQLRRLARRRPSSCAPTSRAPASSAAWSATTSSRACWSCRCSTATPATGKRIDYRALSRAIEKIRDAGVESRAAARKHARDRLRQAGRRPDRRPDAGAGCTSASRR